MLSEAGTSFVLTQRWHCDGSDGDLVVVTDSEGAAECSFVYKDAVVAAITISRPLELVRSSSSNYEATDGAHRASRFDRL
jgi:hypothetical protein